MSSFGVIPCRGKIKCVTQVIAQFLSSSACAGDRGHVSGATRENAHRGQRDALSVLSVVLLSSATILTGLELLPREHDRTETTQFVYFIT